MARPRQHTDDQLLDLVADSLTAHGRRGWTLAEVAADAGVHAATLVKRFASKRGLLLALSRRWIADMDPEPRTDDPHTELLEWIFAATRPRPDRTHAVADIAMLVDDLADDELSALLTDGWTRQVRYLAALVDGARGHRQLACAPDADLAAAMILDIVTGATIRAAAYPAESFDTAHSVTALLETWR